MYNVNHKQSKTITIIAKVDKFGGGIASSDIV